jgi:hypothetical protein
MATWRWCDLRGYSHDSIRNATPHRVRADPHPYIAGPAADQAEAAAAELARTMRACVLYRAIPVGYDSLHPSTIEGAQFDLEPLGHDHNVPSPSHWHVASDLINSLHQT